MSIAMDDVGAILRQRRFDTIGDAIVSAWNSALFRPLLVVSSIFIDEEKRTGFGVIAMHLAALLAGIAALRKLCEGGLQAAVSPWLACTLWLLHPAVAVSLWQMDTVSQTASAAAGLWLMALACGAWRPRLRSGWWVFLAVCGVLTKETFLGWLLPALLLEYRSRRRVGIGAWAAVAIGALYAAARLAVLGASIVGGGQERYAFHFNFVVLKNIVTLAAGGLFYGPMHAIRVLGPESFSWWIAVLGLLAHVSILGTALAGTSSMRADLVRLWAVAVLALLPVLLMGHVSELYLMGPNALMALALARGIEGLRPRATAGLGVGVLLACAGIGLASRSYHFGLTWLYSRTLAAQLRRSPSKPVDENGLGRCTAGLRGHSVYVVTPIEALNDVCTEDEMSASGMPLPAGWRTMLDCSALPERLPW